MDYGELAQWYGGGLGCVGYAGFLDGWIRKAGGFGLSAVI